MVYQSSVKGDLVAFSYDQFLHGMHIQALTCLLGSFIHLTFLGNFISKACLCTFTLGYSLMNSLCASNNVISITRIGTRCDAPIGSLTFLIKFWYGRTRNTVSLSLKSWTFLCNAGSTVVCYSLTLLWKIIFFIDIDWVDVIVLFRNISRAFLVSCLAIDFSTNFRSRLLNLSRFRTHFLYTVKSSSLETLTLFTTFALVLGDLQLRTFMRLFFLLFGVAGKCSLIMLSWFSCRSW